MKHTQRLLEIMAQLRTPETGCPWDLEQDFASIAPYTVEEAYEVADAIAQGDMSALKEELGDLLLQVVFHAQMAEEAQLFDFEAVAESICNKMVARHPHVFGDAEIRTAEAQTDNWERLKSEERQKKTQDGILDGIPLALPALMRAEKLGNRASRAGFDWPDISQVFDKLEEELEELREAANPSANVSREDEKQDAICEELGDLLFVCVNLARHLKVDPEEALRRTNRKFERRFRYVERQLQQQGRVLQESSLDAMEALWNEAKKLEKKGGEAS